MSLSKKRLDSLSGCFKEVLFCRIKSAYNLRDKDMKKIIGLSNLFNENQIGMSLIVYDTNRLEHAGKSTLKKALYGWIIKLYDNKDACSIIEESLTLWSNRYPDYDISVLKKKKMKK